jgi:hypothetical protein
MNWNEIKERILKDAAEKKVSPLEYFISLQCEPSTSTSRGSELSPACLAQTFFTGIKEAFDHQNYVYRCPFTGQWRLMGREDLSGMVDFYIDLGIKRGEKNSSPRDSFAELIQYGNAAEIEPLIYDELKSLKTQLCDVSESHATRNQVLGIQNTLQQVVKLAGQYHA